MDIFPDEIWVSIFKTLDVYGLLWVSAVVNKRWQKLAFDSVTSLNLCGNTDIKNGTLRQLNNLTRLDLSYNKNITDIGIMHMTNLKILNLACNKRINTKCIKQYTNLTKLNICGNKRITDNGISGLINLRKLNINFNDKISTDCLKGLTALEHLHCCGSTVSEHNLSFLKCQIHK